MKSSIFACFLLSTLLSAAPIQVSYLNPGTPALAVGGFYVGPYTLSVNGRTMAAMCMDDFLDVYDGDRWTGNETSVTSSNFSATYLGNDGKSVLGQHYSSSQVYRAEAYLFSLIMKPGADRGDIQEAAWAIMDANTLARVLNTHDVGVENYLEAAYTYSPSFDASGYSILSQTGKLGVDSKQEFMIASVPEPGTIALFGGGLLGLSLLRRRRSASATA